jgi:hypothetical protein
MPQVTSSSTKLNISSLDFDAIKSALQTYLQSQSAFTDYDFAGSGLSVILNILSYNTVYLAYYLNMAANEMFLDSADRRANIVSIAKQLGYTPRSRKSSQAIVNITVVPPMSPTPPATLVIPANTTFNTIVNSINYTFVTTNTITVPYDAIQNQYVANNVPINEGIPYTFRYTVNNSNPIQYIIPNSSVDTETLVVNIQQSLENTLLTTFTLEDDITTLGATSNVYFLQEIDNEQYEVYFGDGILGASLSDGNIVYLTYLACNGDAPNFANIFTVSGNIGGYSNITITTVNAATGGSERESKDSVRFTAPKNYQTQNRAVTSTDYQNIILEQYPNAASVAVWGGETNIPPQYGTVFISIKPVLGYVLTELTKQSIVTSILQSRNIVSIVPQVIDPSYLFLIINSTVKYNAQFTNNSSGQIQTLVANTIQNFANINIGQFNDIFRFSLLTRLIDESEPSITNDLTTVQMYQQFAPAINAINSYTFNFSNPIIPGSLKTTAFIDSNVDVSYVSGQQYYFSDNSLGIIQTYKYVGPVITYTNLNAGTINYNTGTVTLTNFDPSGVIDVSGNLNIIVTPQINDITPIQNQIIVINTSDVTVTMVANPPIGTTLG